MLQATIGITGLGLVPFRFTDASLFNKLVRNCKKNRTGEVDIFLTDLGSTKAPFGCAAQQFSLS